MKYETTQKVDTSKLVIIESAVVSFSRSKFETGVLSSGRVKLVHRRHRVEENCGEVPRRVSRAVVAEVGFQSKT